MRLSHIPHHSEQKSAHNFCSEWWIVGYETDALWELWEQCRNEHHQPVHNHRWAFWTRLETWWTWSQAGHCVDLHKKARRRGTWLLCCTWCQLKTGIVIKMTSQHLKSPASGLLIQKFVQANIKENTKAPRQWPFWEEHCGFPTQRASNVQSVSVWWRHHNHSLASQWMRSYHDHTLGPGPVSLTFFHRNLHLEISICSNLDSNKSVANKLQNVAHESWHCKISNLNCEQKIVCETCIFLRENLCTRIQISLEFVLKAWVDSESSLVQVMASCRTGDQPCVPICFGYVLRFQFYYQFNHIAQNCWLNESASNLHKWSLSFLSSRHTT